MKPKNSMPRRRRPSSSPAEKAARLFARGDAIAGLRLLDQQIDAGNATFVTWRLMGAGLLQIREYAQAIGAFTESIKLNPTDAETRFGLAEATFQMGNVSQAVGHFEYVARHHNHPGAWCNLATIIPGDPDADNQRILRIRHEFSQRLADSQERQMIAALPARKGAERRIRVGYVSAYFSNANYMKPVWELIRRHDAARFELHLFADDASPDDFGWLGEGSETKVHLTSSLPNRELVTAVRKEDLDLLVDLNGYSIPGRLPIYTHRLARCVVAWFNMYATSGLPGIDAIIGDHVVAPAAEDHCFSEHVARLSQSYLSFDVNHATPPIVSPPIMSNGYLTFGSLISQYKLTPQVYDTWADILRQCPTAKLKLGNRALASRCNRQCVLDSLKRRGIAPDRVECLQPAEHFDFLKYYDGIDVALDAFPYNGGTTTTEAIWQGVPVLAINGDRWASRTSATLLMHCHLGDFVAESVDQYVAKAVSLAHDDSTTDRLGSIRSSMRQELTASSLCDTHSMVQDFERALIQSLRAERD
jgi:predicted O-linked N-acetylglucosamine transferase (SPINDLY family)